MSKFLKLFTIKDLRTKVLIVAFLLLVFRLMAAVPIPGIDLIKLRGMLGGGDNVLFGMLDMFSGGGLSSLSIVMLGVGPYITATIIMQLLTMIFPRLKKAYYEEGALGRAKLNRISKYITIPIAFLQAYGYLSILSSKGMIVGGLPLFTLLSDALIITGGSLALTWIGDLISEQKIGNGVSILIFAGIVSVLPTKISQLIATFDMGTLITYIVFAVIAIVVIAGVVYVNEADRKVPITYAKRVRGFKMYGGSSSYLPLKVNQAGVIPIIFAVSLLMFPQFIAQGIGFFFKGNVPGMVQSSIAFFQNQYVYSIMYFALVVVFTYFYTALTFDPKEISKNLQRAGGFIMGIRPGEATTEYLSRVISRITLWGALFLGCLAILPNITSIITQTTLLTLGGTALLIVVSVALEVLRQIDSQLVMREYEGIE